MLGDLLATLRQTGLSSNTVILLTADHGDMLGEHGLWFKKHFFDHASRVPLIVHAPEYFASGRSLVNVSLVDLLPTLCDLAGFKVGEHAPQALDGSSLVSQCEHPENTQIAERYTPKSPRKVYRRPCLWCARASTN